MMAIILVILLVALILAWFGNRQPAILLFMLSMALSIIEFSHHITSHLELQL